MRVVSFSNQLSFRNIRKDFNRVSRKNEGAPEEAPCLTNYRTKTTIAIVV